MQEIIEAAQRYEHHVTPISVTKNISKPISKVQTEVFITDNNYKPPGRYSSNQQRNRSFNKSNVASNDQSSSRKFDSKRYTPNSSQICLGFNRYSKPFCTLENNKCKYGRQHKCSICTKPGCRALNHNHQPRAHANLSSSTGDSNNDNVLVNKIINGVNSLLTARKENVEHMTTVGSGTQLQLSQDSPFGYPTIVNALPSSVRQSGLDLANRNILWTPVTYAGIKISLPINSCCSINLISKKPADLVSQNCPDLKFTKLASPLSVSVASAESKLQAVGMMQILIVWKNGHRPIFSMLVVPGLIRPILFGQNHFKKTKAVTDHDELTVYFKHSSLRFQIKCVDSNPLAHFPNLSNQTSSSVPLGNVYIACLLTGSPLPPSLATILFLNVGSTLLPCVWLVIASSLVGNPLFANQLWLEGSQLVPGVQVLSGPIDLKSLSTSSSLAGFRNFHLPSYNHPKCRPSQPLPEPDLESIQTGILLSQDHMNSPLDFSDVDFQEVYQTTVPVRSNKNKITLPLNLNLGVIQPKISEDDLILHEAAEHTAEQLSGSWFSFITSQTPVLQCNNTSTHPRYTTCPAKTWDLNQQKSEMAKAGLDSSVLAPFLPKPESDHPHTFPPLDSAVFDPHS